MPPNNSTKGAPTRCRQTLPSRIRASIVGLARDMNEGSGVQAITLEHYSSMTEKALTKLVDEANACWTLLDVTVIHRVGRLLPGTPSRWWPWPAAIVAKLLPPANSSWTR